MYDKERALTELQRLFGNNLMDYSSDREYSGRFDTKGNLFFESENVFLHFSDRPPVKLQVSEWLTIAKA